MGLIFIQVTISLPYCLSSASRYAE